MSSPLLVLETYRPQIFSLHIPGLDVTLEPRFYGLAYAIAIIVAYRILTSEAARRRLPLNRDQAMNMTLVMFLFGLAGARIYHAIFEWPTYYANQPFWEIFAIWHGGLAIHGGMLGGILGFFLYSRLRRLNFFHLLDIGALCLIMGQAIGRWGNFANGEIAGPVTDSPLGVVFPRGSPTSYYAGDQPVHPTMIYESVGNFVIFFLLWHLRLKNFRPGMLFCLYLIIYSTWRCLLTPLRIDNQYFILAGQKILAAYVISAVLIAVAVFLMVSRRLWKRDLEPTPLAKSKAKARSGTGKKRNKR